MATTYDGKILGASKQQEMAILCVCVCVCVFVFVLFFLFCLCDLFLFFFPFFLGGEEMLGWRWPVAVATPCDGKISGASKQQEMARFWVGDGQ